VLLMEFMKLNPLWIEWSECFREALGLDRWVGFRESLEESVLSSAAHLWWSSHCNGGRVVRSFRHWGSSWEVLRVKCTLILSSVHFHAQQEPELKSAFIRLHSLMKLTFPFYLCSCLLTKAWHFRCWTFRKILMQIGSSLPYPSKHNSNGNSEMTLLIALGRTGTPVCIRYLVHIDHMGASSFSQLVILTRP
jgi:hypothetical protein